jgi:hypothetical protein
MDCRIKSGNDSYGMDEALREGRSYTSFPYTMNPDRSATRS